MNPALLYYMNGPRGATRNRAAQEPIDLGESGPTVLTEEEDDSPSNVAGFWMIPNGDTYAKLKILKQYTLFGKSLTNVTSGDDAVPVWALANNYQLLAPHFRWLKQALKDHRDLFTGDLEPSAWTSKASSLVAVMQKHRWGFYFAEDGQGYLSIPGRAAYKAAFAKEMFDDEPQAPESITADFSVSQIHVYSGTSYHDTPTKDELKKYLKYKEEKHDKENEGRVVETYKNFDSLIRDYMDGTIQWNKLAPETITRLTKPVYVEWTFMREKEMQPIIAKFLREWIAFAERDNVPHSPVSSYSEGIQRAIKEGDDKSQLNESTNSLMEGMSFAKLLKLTKRNGGYRRGAMVRIGGVWTTDVSTPGRVENARYVFSSPPLTEIERTGAVIYRWKFKSRSDRSTTGQTHRGYLRLLPKKGGIMGFLKKLVKGDGPWNGDCEVWCSCEDFRYRSHWVLHKKGASHAPTGNNGDATNEPPLKTNPKKLVFLCKHLVLAGSVYLADPPKKFREEVQKLQDMARARGKGADYEPPEPKERSDRDPDNPDRGVGMGGTVDDTQLPSEDEDDDDTVEMI